MSLIDVKKAGEEFEKKLKNGYFTEEKDDSKQLIEIVDELNNSDNVFSRNESRGMKEYIPLEWFEDFLVGQNLAWDGRKVPTVTKADICREFSKEFFKRWKAKGTLKMEEEIEQLLAEIENEKIK